VEASHHLILLGSALVLLSIFAGVFSVTLWGSLATGLPRTSIKIPKYQ
jgi:hypothetical protein